MARNAFARHALTALSCLAACYLAGVAYLVLAHAAASAFFFAGAISYYLGVKPAAEVLVGISMVLGTVRDNLPAMLATAGTVVAVVAFLVLRRGPYPLRRHAVAAAVLAVAVAATLAADWTYGISPLNDLPLRSRLRPPTPAPAHRLTVADYHRRVTDAMVGSVVEVEGVLDYQPRMRRFILRGDEPQAPYLNLYVHRGVRSGFREDFVSGREPRFVAELRPLFGQRVKVLGKCFRGQVDAEISDIRPVGPGAADLSPVE